MTRTLDSHVHLDLIQRYHPQRIRWLAEAGCAVVSWAFFPKVATVSDLETGLAAKARCIAAAGDVGLSCSYLTGVHPRSIPVDLKPEAIAPLLMPHLENPRCLGIGEIGLETGDLREREVLVAQLEIARSLGDGGGRVGVHTPRSGKVRITTEALDILAGFSDLAPRLVVDHCTPETIDAVLDAGFWAGVTLSPVKTSEKQLQRIVDGCATRIDRIMCNTDSGSDFFEDLIALRRSETLPPAIYEKLCLTNAARFFNVH